MRTIVAISDAGQATILRWMECTEHLDTGEEEEYIREYTYPTTPAGIYEAVGRDSYCCGTYCGCAARDCHEVEWKLGKCLYELPSTEEGDHAKANYSSS